MHSKFFHSRLREALESDNFHKPWHGNSIMFNLTRKTSSFYFPSWRGKINVHSGGESKLCNVKLEMHFDAKQTITEKFVDASWGFLGNTGE